MSQFNVAQREVSADQIYFDVTVSNFKSTTTQPPVFYYNEQRMSPFVKCPEDYYLSIIRFTMETGTLPVFVPTITPDQGNRNLTIYKITLEYTDTATSITYTQTENVIWIPQDASAPLPTAPNATQNGLQDSAGGYYNCYNYTWLALLITKTFATCYANLDAQVPVALPSIHAPVVYWDSTSNGIVMYADVLGYNFDPDIPLNEIKVFWNAPLYELFPTVPAQLRGYSVAIDPKTFRIGFVNVGATNLTTLTPVPATVPPTYQAITVYQEKPTTANITPITAIVFTSNTLPIHPSQVSTPVLLNDAQQVTLGGNNSDIANIITDLVSDSGDYRPNLVYIPQAQYRYITLYGNRPLYNLDLQIFYRLKSGVLIPFRIASGQSVTVKLAFIKKTSAQI